MGGVYFSLVLFGPIKFVGPWASNKLFFFLDISTIVEIWFTGLKKKIKINKNHVYCHPFIFSFFWFIGRYVFHVFWS